MAIGDVVIVMRVPPPAIGADDGVTVTPVGRLLTARPGHAIRTAPATDPGVVSKRPQLVGSGASALLTTPCRRWSSKAARSGAIASCAGSQSKAITTAVHDGPVVAFPSSWTSTVPGAGGAIVSRTSVEIAAAGLTPAEQIHRGDLPGVLAVRRHRAVDQVEARFRLAIRGRQMGRQQLALVVAMMQQDVAGVRCARERVQHAHAVRRLEQRGRATRPVHADPGLDRLTRRVGNHVDPQVGRRFDADRVRLFQAGDERGDRERRKLAPILPLGRAACQIGSQPIGAFASDARLKHPLRPQRGEARFDGVVVDAAGIVDVERRKAQFARDLRIGRRAVEQVERRHRHVHRPADR